MVLYILPFSATRSTIRSDVIYY